MCCRPWSCVPGGPTRVNERPTDQDQHHARGQKQHVPQQMPIRFRDVVDVQDVMVDDAFDQIEQAPAQCQGTDEGFGGEWHIPTPHRLPQQRQAEGRHDPGEGVEQAIPEHVDLGVCQGRLGIDADLGIAGGQHVVDLEHLVKNDAVHEATHADAQERPGGDQGSAVRSACHVLSSTPLGDRGTR